MTVSLVTIVHGPDYERYADNMLKTARRHFAPSPVVEFVRIPGEPGWPHASGCRYRLITENAHRIEGDHIYLIDADMRFEKRVGAEILARGLVVTIHPGFPDAGQPDAPWDQETAGTHAETTPEERAGRHYHPGAFVGGRRSDFLALAEQLAEWIADDEARDVQPRWYDEAYLNRYLIDHPPALVLPGEYCAWDYLGDSVPRTIVHLDKTPEEFARRGQ